MVYTHMMAVVVSRRCSLCWVSKVSVVESLRLSCLYFVSTTQLEGEDKTRLQLHFIVMLLGWVFRIIN